MKRKTRSSGVSEAEENDVIGVAPAPASKRRRTTPRTGEPAPSGASGGTRKPKEPVEKRLRRHRTRPPTDFWDGYERAITQRFYVLRRERTEVDGCEGETVELSGSTGNVYQVRVEKKPSCNCPHGKKGAQCKHWLFVSSGSFSL